MQDVRIQVRAEARGTEVPLAERGADGPRERARRVAGALFAAGGAAILMGIITAEALYPARYTTADNEISDLGATRPPNSVILQPSAAIFDTTMIVTGVTTLAGAVMLHRALRRRAATIPVSLLGLGLVGVGVFPGNRGGIHQLFAMLTFVAGGLAGVFGARILEQPARTISRVLGAASLLTLLTVLLLGEAGPLGWLGDGGAERWVAYPVLLWLVAFGGYLTAPGATPARSPNAASAGTSDGATGATPAGAGRVR